jgi:hypothetical protein
MTSIFRRSQAAGLKEHGDAILADLGLDWDRVVDLKVRGAVAGSSVCPRFSKETP